jgi:hypothetical protein
MAVTGARIIGIEQIEKALIQAFEQWTETDINANFWEEQFTTTKWNYDGTTTRANPRAFIREASSPRESGVKSYKFESSVNAASASWHWDATNRSGQEYAWYVHEGEGTNTTARGFTDKVSDMKFSFRDNIGKALLSRVQTELSALNAN